MTVETKNATATQPRAAATTAPPTAPSPTTAGSTPTVVVEPLMPPARRRFRLFSRQVLIPLALLILAIAGYVGYGMYRDGQMYVSTDNAQLTGTPTQVGAMNAGRVDTVNVGVGAAVHKGDVVAQVSLPSQVGTAQNGQQRMGFLGAGDTKVDVQAPGDGVVIAVPVGQGATVAAGQPIVAIVDPSQLWVNANIEETHIRLIHVGQPVIVHVDALGMDVPGKVQAVTPATAASFSLLPASNASGNFNKVTQLVPVRISVNLGNQPALLGTSVEVKIQVAN